MSGPTWYTGEHGWAPGHEPMLDAEKPAVNFALLNGWKQSAGGWIYDNTGKRRFVDWLEMADWLKAESAWWTV